MVIVLCTYEALLRVVSLWKSYQFLVYWQKKIIVLCEWFR